VSAATLLAIVLLCACPSNRKVTRIRMDMPYDELVDRVGQPDMQTVMDSGTVVYYYTSWRGESGEETKEHYCVTVRDGRVTRYGVCPAEK